MTDVKTGLSAAAGGAGAALSVMAEQPLTRDRRTKRSFASRLGPFIVFAAFIAFWYFMHYVVLSENRRFILPTPHKVIQKGFIDDVTIGQLWEVVKRVVSDLIPFADVPFEIERGTVLIENLHALWITIEVSMLGLLLACAALAKRES